MRLRPFQPILPLALVVLASGACKSADEGLLPDRTMDSGSGGGGAGGTGGPASGTGGGGSGGAGGMSGMDGAVLFDGAMTTDACADNVELCNGVDDDCDGELDEGADDACTLVIPNARTTCEHVGNDTFCLNRGCFDGYFNCDGLNENGCEPWCSCHVCEDAGADDGGTSSTSK